MDHIAILSRRLRAGAAKFLHRNLQIRLNEFGGLDADLAYANGAFIPGGAEFPARWAQAAATFRATMGARHQPLPGGHDLFLPDGPPRGVLAFIHGGYWLESSPRDWSHLAAGGVARGFAVVMPAYPLAPKAGLSDMARGLARDLAAIKPRFPGPLVLTGHSAGGHLAARLACADFDLPDLARVLPISLLSELAPLAATTMAPALGLTARVCATESPARLRPRAGLSVHVWVGGQERPSFLWQARTLAEAWSCPWTVAPGLHHFDVIDGLTEAESPLMRACLDGL